MDSDQKQEIHVHIRWMIRRDLPEVLAIEDESFEFPWPEKAFVLCLRQRNSVVMVAEYNDRVVGFMLYELLPDRLHVLNFAVAADCRRRGVGSQMVAELAGKLADRGRLRRFEKHHSLSMILLEVRETNLAAQLFFRQHGFRAVSVLRDYHQDTSEDAYLLRYDYRQSKPAAVLPVKVCFQDRMAR